MVKLTEEMVAARSRVSDCTTVKKLNCWGTELTDVSILRKMRSVEVLSLSVNNISSLADFQHCIHLKDLFVRKNNIKDLNEVCYLQGLTNLKNLWLGENPCAEVDGYRLAVIKALPGLEKLDDKIVTPEELQTAMIRGKTLVNPITMLQNDASPPISPGRGSPEMYAEDQEMESRRHYSSSDEQRSYEEVTPADEYQETDKRNANYNASQINHLNDRYQYEEDYDEAPNWAKRNEKEKRKSHFQYQRRPVTRSSNILSAVLCLVKELDYPSLEVVEMAVRTRIDELEE